MAKTLFVFLQRDGVYDKKYSGPDREKARDVAARTLNENKLKEGESVVVVTASSVSTLSDRDLKAVLPKDAF